MKYKDITGDQVPDDFICRGNNGDLVNNEFEISTFIRVVDHG